MHALLDTNDFRLHDLPPDPQVPPGDTPRPPPPAPDVEPPPVRDPAPEHPTPIREPSESPRPMAGPVGGRSRVLICRTGDLVSDRHVGAAIDVFAAAGMDVDCCVVGDDGLVDRWGATHAVLVVAPADADLSALIDSLATAGAAGRAYALVLHGEPRFGARRAVEDALDKAGLIDATAQDRLDRFIGCERPCDIPATFRDEAAAAACAIANAVFEIRAGRLSAPDLLLARSQAN